MTSTPTTRLALRLQGAGDNLNTWGAMLNTDVFTLLDEALGFGLVAVPGSGDVTLTNTLYESNEARRLVIGLTGTPAAAFNVIVPGFDKPWLVHNRTTQAATVKMSTGAGAVIRAGKMAWVYSDATDCFTQDLTLDQIVPPAAALAMNGKKITGLAAGANPLEATNYQQWLDLKAYADSITNSGVLAPGTTANYFLKWNGTGWVEGAIPPLIAGNNTTVSGAYALGTMAVNVDFAPIYTADDFLFTLAIARP